MASRNPSAHQRSALAATWQKLRIRRVDAVPLPPASYGAEGYIVSRIRDRLNTMQTDGNRTRSAVDVLTVVFKSLVNPAIRYLVPLMHFLHLISALPFVPAALAWTSYTVPYSGGGDDTPALISALNSRPELRTDATIVFQEGVTYNLETPVNFPYFKNIIIEIQGNITFANDVEKTEGANSKAK